MSTTGLTYLFVFIPGLVLLYYNPIVKNKTFKNVLLLLASFAFYALIEPTMVLLLVATIIVNYLGVKLFLKTNKTFFKTAVIILDFIILFSFKYINSIFDGYNLLLNANKEFTDIVMPLGVSYYTFNAISYVVDASNKRNSYGLLETSLYIGFFAKISSGPIVQFDNMICEIQKRNESIDLICTGLKRFALGLIKKIIIADSISGIVSTCFDSTGDLSVVAAWVGAISYTIQIYFDFSGCTDMAIGIGNIFGFNFCENFDFPYIAVSVSDFWKRWHISLTKWFTKYIYIPLGGSQVSTSRHIFNMAVVWLFTGVWHGANMTFIIWGLIYFVVLTCEKYSKIKSFFEKHRFFGHVYTMLIVVLLWTVFRSESLIDAVRYVGNMFGIGTSVFADKNALNLLSSAYIPLIAGIIFAFPIKKSLINRFSKYEKLINVIEGVFILFFGIIALCICVSLGSNGTLSLYANF